MSLHINRFIDRIKAAESRGQRDMVLTMTEAKDLHADITKLLLSLQALAHQNQAAVDTKDEVTVVEIQGGQF